MCKTARLENLMCQNFMKSTKGMKSKKSICFTLYYRLCEPNFIVAFVNVLFIYLFIIIFMEIVLNMFSVN